MSLKPYPMVVNGGTKEFTYTSLNDLEKSYTEIAQQYPKNYGWYQCRWHFAAAGIYNSDGKAIGRQLWNALKNNNENLSDEELILFLKSAGAKG